jgi:hypothetical protein
MTSRSIDQRHQDEHEQRIARIDAGLDQVAGALRATADPASPAAKALRAELHVQADSRLSWLVAIRRRVVAATHGPWYAVDCRHQKGGQIRIFSSARFCSAILANVLRSNPNGTQDAQLIGHARQDLEVLLAEVDRLRVELGYTTVAQAARLLETDPAGSAPETAATTLG